MINVIVGENASGKTRWIKRRASEYIQAGANIYCNCITNLVAYRPVADEVRVNAIRDMYNFDNVIEAGGRLSIIESARPISNELIALFSELVATYDAFLLDEPVEEMSQLDLALFLLYLERTGNTYKDCWIATHLCEIMELDCAQVYLCEGEKLRKIAEEDKYELIYNL